MADHWKNGQIPIHYELQCHHYMVVTGADCWYIAVLIYGREFKWYRIERDEELINYLIEVERISGRTMYRKSFAEPRRIKNRRQCDCAVLQTVGGGKYSSDWI